MELQPETSLAPKVDISSSVFDDAKPESKTLLGRAMSLVEDNKLSAAAIGTAVVAGSIVILSKGRETQVAEDMIEGALKAGTRESAAGSELDRVVSKSLMADANMTADTANLTKGVNEISASGQAGGVVSNTFERLKEFAPRALPVGIVTLASLELIGCSQEQVKVRAYKSPEECTNDGQGGDLCRNEYTKAQAKHDATALAFPSQKACEDSTGVACTVDTATATPNSDGSVTTAAPPVNGDATAVPNPAAPASGDATAGQSQSTLPGTDASAGSNPTAPPTFYYRPAMTGYMIDSAADDQGSRDAAPLYSKPGSSDFVTSHGDFVSPSVNGGERSIDATFAANASQPDSSGLVFDPTADAVSRGSYGGYYQGFYHGYNHGGGSTMIFIPGSTGGGYRGGGGVSFHGGSFGG